MLKATGSFPTTMDTTAACDNPATCKVYVGFKGRFKKDREARLKLILMEHALAPEGSTSSPPLFISLYITHSLGQCCCFICSPGQ